MTTPVAPPPPKLPDPPKGGPQPHSAEPDKDKIEPRKQNDLPVFPPTVKDIENPHGDKVFNLTSAGEHVLMIQTHDKSQCHHPHRHPLKIDSSGHPTTRGDAKADAKEEEERCTKMKVEFRFPPIAPTVCQRKLMVHCQHDEPKNVRELNKGEPRKDDHSLKLGLTVKDADAKGDAKRTCHTLYFPPDLSFTQVLLPHGKEIFAEMEYLDKDNKPESRYQVHFMTDRNAPIRPLSPSPIGIVLMEDVAAPV